MPRVYEVNDQHPVHLRDGGMAADENRHRSARVPAALPGLLRRQVASETAGVAPSGTVRRCDSAQAEVD